jgi:hypothetical protein
MFSSGLGFRVSFGLRSKRKHFLCSQQGLFVTASPLVSAPSGKLHSPELLAKARASVLGVVGHETVAETSRLVG